MVFPAKMILLIVAKHRWSNAGIWEPRNYPCTTWINRLQEPDPCKQSTPAKLQYKKMTINKIWRKLSSIHLFWKNFSLLFYFGCYSLVTMPREIYILIHLQYFSACQTLPWAVIFLNHYHRQLIHLCHFAGQQQNCELLPWLTDGHSCSGALQVHPRLHMSPCQQKASGWTEMETSLDLPICQPTLEVSQIPDKKDNN